VFHLPTAFKEVLRLCSDSELNVSHIALLGYLRKSSRFCTAIELSAGCGLSRRQVERTTKGTIIEVLERKGFISVITQYGTERNLYQITPLGLAELESVCLSVRDSLVNILN